MSDSFDIHRNVNTDALLEITDSSTTPRPMISGEKLEELHQSLVFKEISGRPEDFTDQDTAIIPAIPRTEKIIKLDFDSEEAFPLAVTPCETEAIAFPLEEDSGRFVGISLTTVALFRSGIQHYRDKHSGTFPEYLHASRKRCKDYKEEMVHIFYGKDFNGRLPLSYMRYGNKAVRIIPDDSLDDYTVICSLESVDDTPTL